MLLGVVCLALLASSGSAETATRALPGARKDTGPVERVVELIEELQKNLEKDAKVDQDLYDKFACWCEKTSTRKAEAIKRAQGQLQLLGQLILKYTGGIDAGTKTVAEVKINLDEVKEMLAKLKAMRLKKNGEYQASSAELMEALAALEKAIIVLHEATKEPEDKAMLLQGASSSAAALQRAAAGVQAAVVATPTSARLSPDQERHLAAFLQGSAGSPASATIQGILKDMYDSMATELEGLVHEESTQNTQYEELVYVKTRQKDDYQDNYDRNARQIAEWKVLLADVQIRYEETKKQMDADSKFLEDLKTMCDAKHEEFMERKGLRAEELEGIEEALKILTDKSNKALFGKAIKPGMEPSFLQLGSASSERAPNMKAYRALKEQSMKTHSLRLATLAASVRMAAVGHFGEVIGAIDKMIDVLKDEEADDVQQRDGCKDEYQDVASKVADLEWKIENNKAKIKALEEAIKAREEDMVEALEEIKKTKEDIAAMEDTRKEENEEFLIAQKDDQDAIPVLENAKEAMTKYYRANNIPLGPIQGDVKAFLQEPDEFEVDPDKAPEGDFAHKGKRKGQSKGIISILTMLIEDLAGEIKTGIAEEEKAQVKFEKAVAEAKKVIEDLESEVNELKEIIATHKEEVVSQKDDMSQNEGDKDSTKAHKEKITPDCDWILGAFEERKGKRAAEMEGLTKAKEYLAGAKPSSLLQVPRADTETAPKSVFEGLPTASAFLQRQ